MAQLTESSNEKLSEEMIKKVLEFLVFNAGFNKDISKSLRMSVKIKMNSIVLLLLKRGHLKTKVSDER